ncbi:MAG: hypothetical protein GEV10_17190 [Streptosporangiales bacterium]|nr:hypothetical protein [Streptosporangiales bacterium]
MTRPDHPWPSPYRTLAAVLVTAAAFVVGTLVVEPSVYAPLVDTSAPRPLARPCAGVTEATVTAAVTAAPRRDVSDDSDGWAWTCRWRSTDAATVRRENPTLYVSAERVTASSGLDLERAAAHRYGEIATEQLGSTRFGEDTPAARAAGLGVVRLAGLGDRAQVYVDSTDTGTFGRQANVVVVRGDVIVTTRFLAYRTPGTPVRETALRAAREAVEAL